MLNVVSPSAAAEAAAPIALELGDLRKPPPYLLQGRLGPIVRGITIMAPKTQRIVSVGRSVMVVLTLDSARALGGAPIAKSSGRERGIPVSAMLEGEESFDLLSAGREHAAAPKTLPAAASMCPTLETCILPMRMVHVVGPYEKRTGICQSLTNTQKLCKSLVITLSSGGA